MYGIIYIHTIRVCSILCFLNKHYARRRLNGVDQLDAGIRYIFRLFVLTCLVLKDIIVYTKNIPGGDGVFPFYLTYIFDFAR